MPAREGERFVIVAGGTDEGFIDESFLCYPAKNKTGDYHGEMNSALFIRWLTSQLLPALAEPSVLVQDNAPYHSQLTEETRCPTTGTKKAEIVKWLECRSLPFPPHATRPELLLNCKENRPEPRYTVDEIIRSWGHEVIRLPPAHPELTAIKQVWGCMKRHVRSTLQRFTRADLQARLQEAKLIATKVWAGAVRRSRSFEEEYWSSDSIHEGMEPVTITINIDSDDEDELFVHCYRQAGGSTVRPVPRSGTVGTPPAPPPATRDAPSVPAAATVEVSPELVCASAPTPSRSTEAAL
ncbi:hypothetical protein O3P69_000215 [Scylla paramamosain]|uniref:Tc1-like transposase DDE domain-containing protein n=1 Tax=Scylla paramamosain TaxID=85552 RepID=A0AAW0UWB1_SCYPA